MNEWRRTPGVGVYARPERERRFLVRMHPATYADECRIDDLYVTATRLRLRKVTVEGESVFKVTQKVRPRADDPAEVQLTNIYLEEEDFERLLTLGGARLSKTRRSCSVDGVRFAVDEFHGQLAGLLLAEVEVRDLAEPLPFAEWLGAEVTHDDRYSGGSLARLDAGEARGD